MSASTSRASHVPGLVTTLAGLALIRSALLVLGYTRARKLAERAADSRRRLAAPPSIDAPQEFATAVADQIVRAAVFFPGRAICLEQSLTLYALLRRHGLAAELRLGVEPYPFTAHAWVEVDGVPVNETSERIRYFHPLRTRG